MRHFKHILIILFVLASCSTEMDSDLETAINNGYVSESYYDLPGTLYTGDNSTTTTDNTTTTETLSGVSTTSGGIVSLLFTVPSGTTSITMKLEMSGDFDSSSEYVNIYANNNLIGSSVTTGYSGSTLKTPSGWSSKTISSGYWTAGRSSLTIKLNASSGVSGSTGGGQNYRVTLTYTGTGGGSTTSTKLLYHFDDGSVSNLTMSGNVDWNITSSTYASGKYSLKSGAIVHNQTSCVSIAQTTVVGVYSFHYKTSSDSTDYLKFYIDNSTIIAASGSSSSSFTKYSGTVSSAGSHTFKWCYEKDSATSEGSDTVWIDEILMPHEAKTFSSVSAGKKHTCATDNSSTANCWGYGSSGQLGYSSSGTSTKYTPVSVDNISTATSVSAGDSHTCAVLSGGTVKCWGYGSSGQLGYSSSENSNQYTPVLVSGISTATSVSAGEYHTCAVLSGGTVKCWGSGYYGQLGYSSSGTSTKYTPVSVEPFFLDQSGPTGSFAINNKSSYSNGYKTVSFTLTAADSTAIVGYYLSTSSSTPSSSSSAWTSVSETTSLSETVTSSKSLPSGNIYFYVWYKDVLKNISAQYTDSMYCSSSSCY